MNRNRKNLHKVTANVLGLTLASVMTATTAAEAVVPITVYAEKQTQEAAVLKAVYLNGALKQTEEKADGSTKEKAVNTLEQALSLAGESGIIYVCGTVTINKEVRLQIPQGVQIQRVEGFKDALVKITGEGSLLVQGTGLELKDIDLKEAARGSEAFKVEKLPETEKTEPPKAPETVAVPEAPQTPDVPSPEKPSEEPKAPETAETPQAPDMPSPEKPSEEPKAPEAAETPQTPEKPLEDDKDGKDDAKTEDENLPEKVLVETPAELTFKTAKEAETFDFSGEAFKGNGVFSWEKQEEAAALTSYETELTVVFTPKDVQNVDYSQVEGWNPETASVVRTILVKIEELKPQEPEKGENPPQDNAGGENTGDAELADKDEIKDTDSEKTPDTGSTDDENKESGNDAEEAEKAEDTKEDSTEDTGKETEDKKDTEDVTGDIKEETGKDGEDAELPEAEPGKTGEVATEVPKAIPVGSLIDESGVQVYGDFIPFYVDLQVSYNEDVNQLPDAGIGEILSAYELKLWDLKEDEEYRIPEGKKVKVMLPLPENADCFSDLAIAHYLGNNEYEYFSFDKNGKSGNMRIEEKDGREYLAFETASFSPFNVGGQQIVGPGSSKPSSKPSGTNKPSAGVNKPSGTSKPSGNAGAQGNQNNAGAGTVKNPGNSQSKIPVYKVNKGNTSVVIRPVKTGDSTNILQYVLMGAGAVVLAVVALIFGKKKK